jgi:DNA-binding NarL/FixJ family response regulator
VKRIFEEQPGTTAFGDASTYSEALQIIFEHDWDIVVLDLSLGNRSGLDPILFT